MAKRLHYTLEGHRMQPHLANLKHEMKYHPGIQVMKSTRVLDFTGHAGKFRSTVEGPQGRQQIDYGAVAIATGGVEYRPTEYLYGEHPQLPTQLELESKLEQDPASRAMGILAQEPMRVGGTVARVIQEKYFRGLPPWIIPELKLELGQSQPRDPGGA